MPHSITFEIYTFFFLLYLKELNNSDDIAIEFLSSKPLNIGTDGNLKKKKKKNEMAHIDIGLNDKRMRSYECQCMCLSLCTQCTKRHCELEVQNNRFK